MHSEEGRVAVVYALLAVLGCSWTQLIIALSREILFLLGRILVAHVGDKADIAFEQRVLLPDAHNFARLVDDEGDNHEVEQTGDKADHVDDDDVSERLVLVEIGVVVEENDTFSYPATNPHDETQDLEHDRGCVQLVPLRTDLLDDLDEGVQRETDQHGDRNEQACNH